MNIRMRLREERTIVWEGADEGACENEWVWENWWGYSFITLRNNKFATGWK